MAAIFDDETNSLESMPLLPSSAATARDESIAWNTVNEKKRKLSPAAASANLINTIVGAGMMALPAAYMSLGIIGGTFKNSEFGNQC